MKQSEINGMTLEELQERLGNLEADQIRMRMTHHISPLENPMSLRAVRKDIARLHTELKKRQLEA